MIFELRIDLFDIKVYIKQKYRVNKINKINQNKKN